MAFSNHIFWTFLVVLIGGISIVDNAEAKTISVVGVLDTPYLMKNEDGTFEGFIPDLLDKITERMGVNYTMTNVSRYGVLNPKDNTWIGMMGEVVNNNADVAGLLTVTRVRSQSVDFSYPVMSVGPSIVLKRPPTDRPRLTENLDTLFKPFDFTVWLMTILAFVVTSTVLYMISHFNPYEWRRMFKDREATLREAESFSCMNSFWFALSALSWQGYIRAPRSVGGRLVVTGWWFFVLLLILSYLASLTNLLRMGPKPLEAKGYSAIRSFNDLAHSEKIKVLVVPGGSTEAYFEKSLLTKEKLIAEKIKKTKNHIDIENTSEGIKEVRESPFSDIVMILESSTAKYVTQEETCDLYMVNDYLITSQHAFAFAPGSQYTSAFNDAILTLREDGHLKMIEDKWFPMQCENTVVDSEDSGTYEFQKFYKLDLGAFFGAVLILLIALILGGAATLIEICIYKWAETHVDEEETKEGAEAEVNNKLIDSSTSRGGATQV